MLLIQRMEISPTKATAVVYYAVADFSGNVTKQSRVFPADIADIENNGNSVEELEDVHFPNMLSSDDGVNVGVQTQPTNNASIFEKGYLGTLVDDAGN